MSASPSPGDLVSAVEQARSRRARLRLVDLHVHSPESGPGEYTGPELTAQEFLDAVRTSAPALEVLGICDHFRCRVASQVAELAGPSPLLVLPGIELALELSEFSPDAVHMVVLFSPTARSEDIYSVVHQLGGPQYADANCTTRLGCRCDQLLDALANEPAVCIAAHVNSDAGARDWARKSTLELVPLSRRRRVLQGLPKRTPQQQAELAQVQQRLASVENAVQVAWLSFLGNSDVAAIELNSAADLPYYRGEHIRELGVRPVACLLSSDAHSSERVAQPPKQTYLRLGGLSLSAVRTALGDPETRVRLSPPSPADRPVIEGIRFVQTDATDPGFFRDATIGFSENLTCIIGSRGSGKSAVIEAIRHTLDLPRRGDEATRAAALGRRDVTLKGTRVELLLRPFRQHPILASRSLGTKVEPRDAREPGELVDPAIVAGFRTELYGWSEIEHLAQDQEAQRELLDAGSAQASALRAAIAAAREALKANRGAVVSRLNKAAGLGEALRKTAALRRQIQLLETHALSLASQDRDNARLAKTRADELADTFSEVAAPLLPVVPGAPSALEAEVAEWGIGRTGTSPLSGDALAPLVSDTELDRQVDHLVTQLSSASAAAQAVSHTLQGIQSAAQRRLSEADGKITGHLEQQFAEEIADGRTSLEALMQDARNLAALKGELEGLQRTEADLRRERRKLTGLIGERRTRLLPAFVDAQERLSAFRGRRAQLVTRRLNRLAQRAPVTVHVLAGGDRSDFERALYDPAEEGGHIRGSGVWALRERGIAGRLAKAFLPWEFARALRKRDAEHFASVLSADSKGDAAQDAERLISWLRPDPDLRGSCDSTRLDGLLSMEEIAADDTVVISLDGMPIESLSPGQRCTALLPIILSQGDWPLVVDQPEDNLDNKMIFHVVVDVLRGLKDKRQVIVATHNPNIPVSGDAEQVIVLGSESREEGRVDSHGAIDYQHVVSAVIELMEGGEEAFKVRAMKYGFDLLETITHRSRSDQ